MNERIVTSLGLCATLCWAGIALAAPPSAAHHARKSVAKKSAAPAKKAAGATGGATADAKTSGPRTLQDIHIEGEIPTPQVLFITARDQRRFVDFQTQRYLKTSQEVGEQTVFPSRIVVTGNRPADQPKETRP